MSLGSRFCITIVCVHILHCGATNDQPTAEIDEWPCPRSEDIRPCICSVKDDLWIDLICDEIQEDEFIRVFASTFPDPEVNLICIQENFNLKILSHNVFRNISFRALTFRGGVLEDVREPVLYPGYSTALSLDFTSNKIRTFPFGFVEKFLFLTNLLLGNNAISSFPLIKSSTLQVLSLAYNPLRSLPSWAFMHLPALISLDLDCTGLTVVPPGTFLGLKSLAYVFLADNQLTHTAADTLAFVSTDLKVVSLSHNELTHVNGISGLGTESEILIDGNNISHLLEQVWKPILDSGCKVWISGNPLACDCKLAWVFRNETYPNLLFGELWENGQRIEDAMEGILRNCP